MKTDIGLLRLAAQRIAAPGLPSPADTVRWLTGMQAQDHGGALTSVALRTTGGTREAVEAAFNAGEIVKSWPMRGTLHLAAAEDLQWLLELTAPRVLAGAAARRAHLGLDLSTLELAGQVAIEALTGGRQLSRAELLAVWDKAGAATTGQRGYHMGYGDRTAVLPAEFANLIVPGGNGMFKPTVVNAGQVIGTWKHTGRGAKRTIEAAPFTSFTATVDKSISRAYARLP